MRIFVMVVFVLGLFGFVSAIDVDIECPSNVGVGEEFECSIDVRDVEGGYDLKIEIEKDGKSVSEIWKEGDEKWQSAYYYLKEFGSDSVRLRVKEAGDYEGILKIRRGEKRDFFEFRIEVGGGDLGEGAEVIESDEEGDEKEKFRLVEDSGLDEGENNDVVELNKKISLNSDGGNFLTGEVVYESGSSKSLRYAPYVFSVFLIFVLVVVLWSR